MQQSTLRIKRGFRSKHHFYDYDRDGMCPKDRIKGFWKRHEWKWKKRHIARFQ